MKTTPMKLTRLAIQCLQALRAGPMTAPEIAARFVTTSPPLLALQRAGLVAKEGCKDVRYRLTEAGRAACPPRNPASARLRQAPQPGPDVRGPTGMRQAPPRMIF
jgi:hypothetical protein